MRGYAHETVHRQAPARAAGLRTDLDGTWGVAWATFPPTMTDDQVIGQFEFPWGYSGPAGTSFLRPVSVWRTATRALARQHCGLDI